MERAEDPWPYTSGAAFPPVLRPNYVRDGPSPTSKPTPPSSRVAKFFSSARFRALSEAEKRSTRAVQAAYELYCRRD